MKSPSNRFVIFVALLLGSFQNCSPINFEATNKSSSDYSVSATGEEEIQPDPVDGNSNGDAYSGKVTKYINWSKPGECGGQEITEKAAILEENQTYLQVKEDCKEISPKHLDPRQINIVDADNIVYDNRQYTQIFPESCQEIFDIGGAEGNGIYYVDPDGPNGNEYIEVYCDMDIISKGWSAWSQWSECSATCGTGEKKRTRTCKTGQCDGSSEEIISCEQEPCSQ